jgi:hypothetical protein
MSLDSYKPTGRSNSSILAVSAIVLIAVGVIVWWLGSTEFGIGGDNTMEGVVAQIRA